MTQFEFKSFKIKKYKPFQHLNDHAFKTHKIQQFEIKTLKIINFNLIAFAINP